MVVLKVCEAAALGEGEDVADALQRAACRARPHTLQGRGEGEHVPFGVAASTRRQGSAAADLGSSAAQLLSRLLPAARQLLDRLAAATNHRSEAGTGLPLPLPLPPLLRR